MLYYFFGLVFYVITMAALVRLISLSSVYCIPIKLFSCLCACSFICCPILLCTIFFTCVFICLFISFLVYYLCIYLCTYLSMFTSGHLLSLPHSLAAHRSLLPSSGLKLRAHSSNRRSTSVAPVSSFPVLHRSVRIIQGIYKRMVRFQKLTRNFFLTLYGNNLHHQQQQISKFLIRYQQFASHAYCGATGPVSKMVSQQEKAFCVLRFEVSRSVITVHEVTVWRSEL